MYTLINSEKTKVFLLGLFLCACSSNVEQPQWINEPSASYPAEKYLTATGEANSREAAGNRARASLSQIFQVAIKDSGMDFSQAIVTRQGDEQKIENKLRTSRFVSADARQVLEGTQIVEYWVDVDGTVHGLAVLEKAPANRRFRASVRAADRKTAGLVDYARQNAPNPVVALRALEKARLIQRERENANRNLTVTAGKGISGNYSGEQLDSMIRQALAKLQFSLNDKSSDIKAEVESAMASLGIQQNTQSIYTLSSKLDTEPLQKKQGWYWLRGSVELSLDSNGEVIAQQRWPVKVSALDQGMVEQRAKDTLNNKLGGYLYQMLTTANEK